MRRRRTRATLLLGGLALLAARAWGLPLPLWGCPLRHLSGVPCPTCFLTRSLMACFRGDLAGALQLHAFGPPLLGGAVWLIWAEATGRPLPERRSLLRLGGGIAALVLAYWLWRLGRWWQSGLLAVWMSESVLGQWWHAAPG